MKKQIADPTVQMVMNIYNLGVPSKSEIANPFSANKRKSKSALVEKQKKELSDDISLWNSKSFVDYFSQQYKNNFGGIYKKTYSNECSVVNEIIEFMDANELDKNEWTKKFIDWCFVNKDFILNQTSTFILNNLKKYLNTFYQQEIYSSKSLKPAICIFDELVKSVENGKTKEILSIYGIPIVATYFINHKNISVENIISGLNMLFNTLLQGSNEEIQLLTKIVQRSINRSPYPEYFHLIDWRSEFPSLVNKYKNETWWRDSDYTGNSQFKFERLMKINVRQ